MTPIERVFGVVQIQIFYDAPFREERCSVKMLRTNNGYLLFDYEGREVARDESADQTLNFKFFTKTKCVPLNDSNIVGPQK